MNIRRIGAGLIAAMTGLLIASTSHAGKPDIYRYTWNFDFLVVDCDTFEVWVSGWERDTEKWWYDEFGDPVRLQWSINVTESEYYNKGEPDKFITQGKKGVGENVTIDIDFTTGDEHQAGGAFRITIPGIGHVLLSTGNWIYDASEDMWVHHGPGYVLAEGDTGLALCEALE